MNNPPSNQKKGTHFKEISAGIKSCFSLTTNERLVILLILTLFLIGLGLRWRHLSRERSDGYEPPARPPAAPEAQLLRAGNASHSDAGGPEMEMNVSRK